MGASGRPLSPGPAPPPSTPGRPCRRPPFEARADNADGLTSDRNPFRRMRQTSGCVKGQGGENPANGTHEELPGRSTVAAHLWKRRPRPNKQPGPRRGRGEGETASGSREASGGASDVAGLFGDSVTPLPDPARASRGS